MIDETNKQQKQKNDDDDDDDDEKSNFIYINLDNLLKSKKNYSIVLSLKIFNVLFFNVLMMIIFFLFKSNRMKTFEYSNIKEMMIVHK